MKKRRHGIPAASIGDTDLKLVAKTNPTAAREIRRLAGLMSRGEETPSEFLRLCELLHEVGSVADAEHLLRRNVDFYDGYALYNRLFGMAKQEEFERAIRAFEVQFNVQLILEAKEDFLLSTYRSPGGTRQRPETQLLSRPCTIRFGYIEQNRLEADIVLFEEGRDVFEADECLLMFFKGGLWEIADPLEN